MWGGCHVSSAFYKNWALNILSLSPPNWLESLGVKTLPNIRPSGDVQKTVFLLHLLFWAFHSLSQFLHKEACRKESVEEIKATISQPPLDPLGGWNTSCRTQAGVPSRILRIEEYLALDVAFNVALLVQTSNFGQKGWKEEIGQCSQMSSFTLGFNTALHVCWSSSSTSLVGSVLVWCLSPHKA